MVFRILLGICLMLIWCALFGFESETNMTLNIHDTRNEAAHDRRTLLSIVSFVVLVALVIFLLCC